MSTYILKAYAVISDTVDTTIFRKLDAAKDFGNWVKFDQGDKNVEITEKYIECPMIDGTVYIPENVL